MFGKKDSSAGEMEVMSNVKFHAIKVKVTPQEPIPATGPIDCDINVIGSAGGGKVTNNEIELDPKEGPFCLQFDLHDHQHVLDWDGNPIWIQEGNCPEASCPQPDQIWVDNTPEKGVLTVMNMNVGPPCKFSYRLNFTGGRYWDPIISNGGGNTFD